MEVVAWEYKNFQQIEEQDNPAFGEDECVMVCCQGRGGWPGSHIVLLIRDQLHEGVVVERVEHKGIFHAYEDALVYADALANAILMHASPGLLATLERIFELADDRDNRMMEDLDAIAEEARAAIARAKGE